MIVLAPPEVVLRKRDFASADNSVVPVGHGHGERNNFEGCLFQKSFKFFRTNTEPELPASVRGDLTACTKIVAYPDFPGPNLKKCDFDYGHKVP